MKIFTLGYSGFLFREFAGMLRENHINAVIDVRSSPYSRHFPDYDKENIKYALAHQHIYYRSYAREFGARQDNPAFYTDGIMDFEKFSCSEQFLQGIEKLTEGMQKGYSFALMCAEKEPVTCHRAILVAKAFRDRNFQVIHLMPDGNHISQNDIDYTLIQKFFPNHNQLSFNSEILSDEEMLKKAYILQNKEIGYKWSDIR